MTLEPGARLGTYEILGPLGAGGMGEVYRARDRKLGREVALKILSEAFASDPSRVARFEREARMLAALNHPSIAAIYGAEEDGDFRYIVMELVAGETLAEKLVAGALPVPEALDLAMQIAEALSVAHERGVIHRDLKPANIKVTPDGRVKVLDLGLAKALAIEITSDPTLSKSPTVVLDESRPGSVLGSPGFMSPEQARGKETDRRTDIWAFGCVLFEMLTGRRAFPGETVPDALAAILEREPDWKSLPAATPARIRDLLRRCLEKDANRRLRDAGDARLEIERELEEAARGGPSRAGALRRRWPAAAAALAGLTLVAGGWLALRCPRAASPGLPERKQLAVLPFRNLTGDVVGLGFVETVSARLSRVPGVQIIALTAAAAAARSEPDALEAVRRLGANLAVVPALQREGDRVRITYHVVDVRNSVQIAANSLTGSASDFFALQDDMADSVAKDLRLPGSVRISLLPPGLDAGQQERYLQAIGLLKRDDKRDSVEQALQLLRGLAEERPNSGFVQAALGRVNLAMFVFTKDRSWADRAAAAADAARALDPGLPEVDVTIGETLLATGRPKEANEAFRRALAANPDDFLALLGLGRASQNAGDFAGAETALQKASELQPSSVAACNQLGALYYLRGRYRDAAEMFRRATRVAPDSYRALSNLGGASTMLCDFAAATDAYRRALALRPDSPVTASNLGLNQLWTGRYAEAIESLETAARNGPNNFVVWGNLGDAYRGAGRTEKAAEAYGRSLALAREKLLLNPRDTQAHQCIATSLAKTGHAAQAEEPMRQALSLDPRDPSVLSDAAIVAALAGRTAQALEWLRKAVEAGYCRDILLRQPEFTRLKDEPEFRSIVTAPRAAAGT
ncbi:MAG: protein kinase domain-containing protein [Thermoanaerobaculia bacterium]